MSVGSTSGREKQIQQVELVSGFCDRVFRPVAQTLVCVARSWTSIIMNCSEAGCRPFGRGLGSDSKLVIKDRKSVPQI
jgi:hypothetical protein